MLLYLQIVAEGANGPTTIGAEKILHGKNVLVIPVRLPHNHALCITVL